MGDGGAANVGAWIGGTIGVVVAIVLLLVLIRYVNGIYLLHYFNVYIEEEIFIICNG